MKVASRSPSLVVLVSVAAALLTWFAWRMGFASDAEPPIAGAPTTETAEDGASEEPLRAPERTVAPAEREAIPEPPPPATFILCVRRADEVPVAGVSLFVDGAAISGPTADDGLLEFQRRAGRAGWVWARGWVPVRIAPAAPVPKVVRLEPADATLLLEVDNLGEAEIVRTRLEHSRIGASAGMPWEPMLERQGPTRVVLTGLAPGAVDAYVLTQVPGEAPRWWSRAGVELTSGATTTVRLDASGPPAHEEDS